MSWLFALLELFSFGDPIVKPEQDIVKPHDPIVKPK